MEEEKFEFEAYADYEIVKKNILIYYMDALEKMIAFHKAVRKRTNVTRKKKEFTLAVKALFLVIYDKLPKIKDYKQKPFTDLEVMVDYLANPNREMTSKMATEKFLRLQEFLNCLGVLRIERARLPGAKAFSSLEEGN